MSKKIAVIGCGYWGKNIIRNFAELNSLYAVCDPNTSLSQKYADKYNVKNLTFPEILTNSNIKGVVLAVPAVMHANMAIEAMNSGKNVFVEKPLAMNNVEGTAMIDLAKKNNVKLMVGHLLHYHPVFKAALNIIKSGKLGVLDYVYSNRLSFGKVRTEEDVIWSFAPHDISMILAIADSEPRFIRTESKNILRDHIADVATIHIEFFSGLKSNVNVSWLHPHKEHKLVAIGESAMLIFDDTNEWEKKLALHPYKVKISENISELEKSDVEYVKVDKSEPLLNECKHFIDVVNGKIEPHTDGQEGLRVTNILTTASLSAKKKITLEPQKI